MFKKSFIHSIAAASLLFSFAGCGSSDSDDSSSTTSTSSTTNTEDTTSNTDNSSEVTRETLANTISSDLTLDASKQYKISGLVTVKDEATLTIPAGTTLYGDATGYMVIAKGAKIIADGTVAEPIIFTSEDALINSANPEAGQWGGLTVLGQAPTNHDNPRYEVDEANPDFDFGGTVANDNSGILRNVKILNSGIAINADQEINGLSLAGVGSGTVVENIYVENSGDDGIEIWGGTVNLTNIEIKNALDDSFDADYGYTGTVDGLVVNQVEDAHAGMEISSGGTEPMTSPTIKNFVVNTVAGSDEGGIYIKDDTTAPTFINGTINHLGLDGGVYVKKALTDEAKAQISFSDITVSASTKVSGDGAGDISGLQDAVAVTRETLSNTISSDLTLNKNVQYKISGLVTVKDRATLTIPAGTTLYGDATGYMVIAKGSKIVADGTVAEPIIFTSEDVLINGANPEAGQWGGLTVLGQSTVNHESAVYEVDESNPDFAFGGTVANDNSGILRNVKILNSGITINADQEINGLSLAGVGSGTVVENIYVENSGDDGIEIWGGTVNLTNIEVKNALDDSFDADYGYTGTVDGLVVNQVEDAYAGMEISSGGTEPMTSPTIKNFVVNTVAGSTEGGIYIKDDTTAPTFQNGTINHLGLDGGVYVKKALTDEAKAQISFSDVTISNAPDGQKTGDGADDIVIQ